ncbi:HNH endonuclease signature motif containing protein [Undibacterium sp. Ren11W]|uniref:HNH endonuclease signature motif containing protein n=1 Tax=Undibacterium sp. Ren11W TaxID=3413045 RepID=UPI003BF28AAD
MKFTGIFAGNLRRIVILVICAGVSLSYSAQAKQVRSTAAKHEFQRTVPCPANNQARGKCPGYVIDHIDPLCNGGADASSNMQWQTIVDAKKKDIWEREICRLKRNTKR